MFAVGAAALMAGCSDASRFSADPFSDPFQASATGPSPRRTASRGVDRSPTGAITAAPSSDAPVQSRPLPPPGASGASAAPAPAPQAAAQPAPGPAGAYEHWSSQGGTPVTVGQGETAAVIANRYGVPTEALVRVNGFSSASQVQPGARLVIPVYRATATAAAAKSAAPPAPAPHAKAEEGGAPKATPAKTAAKPDTKPAPAKSVKAEQADAAKKPAKKGADASPADKPKSAKLEEKDEDEKPAAKQPHKAAETAPAPAKQKVARVEEEEDAPTPPHRSRTIAPAPVKPKTLAAKDDDEEGTRPAAKSAPPAKVAPAKVKTAAAAKLADDQEEDDKPAAKAVPKAKVAKVEPKPEPKAERVARVEQKYLVPVQPSAPAPVAARSAPEVREPVRTAAVEKPVETASAAPQPRAGVDHTPTASIPPAVPAHEEKAAPAETTVVASADGKPEFRWPARGRVIQGFTSGGNDGINISVPEGTQVKAAEGGVVAYAGNELKGYGNLVLIRHPNGYVTAYAHNGEIAVKRGDHVNRGQTIAKSGQSGNVSTPQLHFELRKGATPVDPTNYLAAL